MRGGERQKHRRPPACIQPKPGKTHTRHKNRDFFSSLLVAIRSGSANEGENRGDARS